MNKTATIAMGIAVAIVLIPRPRWSPERPSMQSPTGDSSGRSS